MTEITLATNTEDYKIIEDLANIIWREHYTAIIGKPQVDYMLDKFQSVEAIEGQISEGYEYYLLSNEDINVGYISINKEDDSLFLSKIYVVGEFRGRDIGKTALIFVEDKAKAYNLNKIRLTVNVNNLNSIKAYEKLGFKKIGPIVIDIGNGFIMDDFEMMKEL